MSAVNAPWYLRPWGDEAVGLPRDLWILWWGSLLNRVGGFVVPFFALFLGSRGFTITQISVIAAAYGAGSFVASLVGGVLTDSLGRKTTLLLSVFTGAASMVWLGFASGFPTFVAAALTTGFTTDAYRPAVMAWAHDLVAPSQRRIVSSLFYWVVNLGFAVASLLGGLAVAFGYQTLVLADALTMAAFGLVVLFGLREPSRQAREAAAHEGELPGGLRATLFDPRLMWFVMLSFNFALAMWQNSLALPLDMQAKGFSEREYGMLAGLNGLAITLLQPTLSRLLKTRSLRGIIAWGSVAFGVGLAGYAIADSYWLYALTILIWTFGEMAALPASGAYIMQIAPPHMRGRYQGIYTSSWGIASCMAPLLGARLFEQMGTQLWWLVGAALCLSALGYWALIPRQLK